MRDRTRSAPSAAPRPDYTDTQFMGSVGGPFRIPGVRNRPVFFAGYQHSSDHNAFAQSAVMPTLEERAGDFSGGQRNSRSGDGPAVSRQRDTRFAHQPPGCRAAGAVSGAERRRRRLQLRGDDRFADQSGQFSIARESRHRQQGLAARDGELSALGSTDTQSVFGFVDSAERVDLDTAVTWSHRFNQFVTLRTGYQFLRQTNDSTPHFANLLNVSGAAGIAGNNQEAVNWGPPALVFSSGTAGVATGQYLRQASRIHAFTAETLWRTRGGHNLTFGGAVRPQTVDVLGQQDARGSVQLQRFRLPDRIWRIFCWARRILRRSRSGTPTRFCTGAR